MSAEISLGEVVLDCPDPRALGAFYAEVLGGSVASDSTDEWVSLEGSAAPLAFQRVRDFEPPSWPDGVPQQVHLDLRVDEFESAHERVTSLGATALDPVDPPTAGDRRTFRVYADPAGHPFCLCRC